MSVPGAGLAASNRDDDIGDPWRISTAGQAAEWEGMMGQQSGPLGADVAVTHILVGGRTVDQHDS